MLFLFRERSSARREFARFLPKCWHVGRTRRERKNEKAFLFSLVVPAKNGAKRERQSAKILVAASEISRGNLGISLSSWSSKNPDNFTARTIYGRVSVTAPLPPPPPPLVQLTFSRAMENVSGRSWLLAVVRVAIEHAHEPRRRVAFCSEIDCTRVYASLQFTLHEAPLVACSAPLPTI